MSYAFIFHKYKETRLMPTQMKTNGSKDHQLESTFKIFRNSRFFVSLLLILNILVLVVVPDLTYLFYGVVRYHKTGTVDDITLILFLLSYLFDAFIYTFIQRPVRRLLWKKMLKVSRCYPGLYLDCIQRERERVN